MSLLEGLFVGRSASEAHALAQHTVELLAEDLAFDPDRGEAHEARLAELREAIAAVHTARDRIIGESTRGL